MQEATKVSLVRKDENHSKKLYLTFSDKAGEGIELKMGMTIARQLIKLLFVQVSPDWGGTREGAGKRKD